MSIFHYFIGNDKKRAAFIFNFIAPIYGFIDRATSTDYQELIEAANQKLNLEGLSVLDVGTGTGSWVAALKKTTKAKAIGVDMSEKMLVQAVKNYPEIEFIHQDGEDLGRFESSSFDVVTASFVLHGMKIKERTKVLAEMKRVASKYVIIQDFHGKIESMILFLEILERSDYKFFIKNFESEMKQMFKEFFLIKIQNRTLYIGIKKEE